MYIFAILLILLALSVRRRMDVFLIDKRKFPTFSIKLFWPLARFVSMDVALEEKSLLPNISQYHSESKKRFKY